MPRPVVRIELRVEPRCLTGSNRGDPQFGEPGISHRSHVAPLARDAPIKPRHPRSQPCIPDYEKVVTSTVTQSSDIFTVRSKHTSPMVSQ